MLIYVNINSRNMSKYLFDEVSRLSVELFGGRTRKDGCPSVIFIERSIGRSELFFKIMRCCFVFKRDTPGQFNRSLLQRSTDLLLLFVVVGSGGGAGLVHVPRNVHSY